MIFVTVQEKGGEGFFLPSDIFQNKSLTLIQYVTVGKMYDALVDFS